MPASGILASNKIQADLGSLAHDLPVDQSGAPAPATAGEAAAHLGIVSEIDSVLSGGTHPETIWQLIDRSVVQPTDSLAGHFGGLIPRVEGALASGPAGGVAAAKNQVAAALKRMGL
jgi:hypothetical protein